MKEMIKLVTDFPKSDDFLSFNDALKGLNLDVSLDLSSYLIGALDFAYYLKHKGVLK